MKSRTALLVFPFIAGAAALGLGSVALARTGAGSAPTVIGVDGDVASDIDSIGVLSAYNHGAGTVVLNGQVLKAGPRLVPPALAKGARALVYFTVHHGADGSVTISSITPASAAEDARWRGKVSNAHAAK